MKEKKLTPAVKKRLEKLKLLEERAAKYLTCRKCNVEKELIHFRYVKDRKINKKYTCKECVTKEKEQDQQFKNEDIFYKYKVCSNCHKEKPLIEYNRNKSCKDGHIGQCKSCVKEWRQNNKETLKEKRKDYSKVNIEVIKQRTSSYYKKNKKDIQKAQITYRQENKSRITKQQVKYHSNRKKIDPIYNLRTNLAARTAVAFKAKYWRKGKGTEKLLGTNFKIAVKFLNNNPYGFKVGDPEIDIDHIVPLSSANTGEELINLCYYTNLQLLPKEYNRFTKKDNVFDEKDFKKWLKQKGFNHEG